MHEQGYREHATATRRKWEDVLEAEGYQEKRDPVQTTAVEMVARHSKDVSA